MTGTLTAIGPCFVCRTVFQFDPDRVASVWVDMTCGLPPDLGGDLEAATRQPVCPRCVRVVNAARAQLGQAPFPTAPEVEPG